MNTLRLLTAWGTLSTKRGSANFPQVLLDHPLSAGDSYQNATGLSVQGLPTPNMFVAQLNVSDTLLAAIQADATYFVLWATGTTGTTPPTGSPSAAEVTALQTFLTGKGVLSVIVLNTLNTRAQNEANVTAFTVTTQTAVVVVPPPMLRRVAGAAKSLITKPASLIMRLVRFMKGLIK